MCLALLPTITPKTITMKKEQFNHNIAKAKRQAEAERQKELIKKYEQDFDSFLTKLQLNHLTK
jgi:DNA replication protein DnaD